MPETADCKGSESKRLQQERRNSPALATKISINKGREQCAAMGIDINETVINGKTFEHYTIEKENDIGCLRELTDNKVDFNARDKDGITPLMIATLWGQLDKLAYLLKGADIYVAANCGTTALHLAACWGRTDCLVTLLDKMKVAVDVNVKTRKDGATPLHMAAQNGHLETVKVLLKKYQTSVNEKMNDGCTPLHLAARNRHKEIVRAFMEIAPLRIQVDVTNDNGDTVLHEAAREGNTEIIKALLKIDSSMRNKDGETALHLAAREGHTEAVKVLLDIAPIRPFVKIKMVIRLSTWLPVRAALLLSGHC
ncbi:ankyrin repeat domain-containing protein [Endozoicomonas sp. ONNA2]|uniref:ankyrin repeat domain-containing protein n=1 Tax=Endozoicomonas sp. ONNA2 TaxID=2828741 RepID=UPI002147BC07|nr:ankyrin repeat domain-containing protein [Endozoicomonas sp. ONNA2]